MPPTGFGGLVRRFTRTFTGGGEPDPEAQKQKDPKKSKEDGKMYQNRYPGYFMTAEILREFLNKEFGHYNPQIKVVTDYYVFMTPDGPLTEAQTQALDRLTDKALH